MLLLSTDRLTLRPFRQEDADDLYAYQSLPEVAKYLYRPPYTPERCAEVIEERVTANGTWQTDGEVLVLAVCPRDEPGVVGEVVLKLASARARQVEIGWVFNPVYAGRGYATEAARALAVAAFDELHAHRVFARLDAENTASARICERLGMRLEARFVENDLDGDRWGTECVYAALAADLKR
ncbi:GNAT family N-acetyltransferase [Streptomyces sp. NPDC050504]|uniref:GNAT family N-acetyltransferase n=1 Tax=Streptomyces sp. NPDC050504 TaxID=3365618 RepID=UPI0037A98516